MRILDRIRKRASADNGDAVIILGIMLIVVVIVIGAMLLDISKAFQMKSSYNDAAQKATQAAIRYQNSDGYLKAEAVAEALRVYETIARPSTINNGPMSYCATFAKPTRNVEITIRLMKVGFIHDSTADIVVSSNQIFVGDKVEQILPRIGLSAPAQRQAIENGKYIGIEMQLFENTPNIILPSASRLAGVNDGVAYDCQTLGIRAGASKYTGTTGQHN